VKVLITGSTGFVGRHLLVMLEELHCEVFHLVRTEKGFSREFVWDFRGPLPEGLPFCDVVIHLAAHVDFSLNLDITQYNVNVVSTVKLAAYAKSHNSYFILASMVGIHGGSQTLIDKHTPINPENNYSMSKYLAEEVVKACVDKYSILRICGIYGLDGPEHLGLNRTISNAVHKKKPPVLKGPGKAKRNYICVLDVAGWIMYLVKHFKIESAAKREKIQEILYMSGQEIMTIEDYLQTIVDIIFPKMDVKRIEGDDSMDYVVKASPSPFTLVTFKEYIKSLLY
jgi:nucleoside-diphosphate-sugar epimerase